MRETKRYGYVMYPSSTFRCTKWQHLSRSFQWTFDDDENYARNWPSDEILERDIDAVCYSCISINSTHAAAIAARRAAVARIINGVPKVGTRNAITGHVWVQSGTILFCGYDFLLVSNCTRGSVLPPLLRLTPPMEGFPWDDLRKILHGGQRTAKVQNGEEILPKVSTAK